MRKHLSITDLLVFFFLFAYLILAAAEGTRVAECCFMQALCMGLLYSLCRTGQLLFQNLFRAFLLIGICLWSLFETFKGIMQLVGLTSSNHYMFAMTGSFLNPGPYGGFLAVCVSLLAAFALTGCEETGSRFKRLFLRVAPFMAGGVAVMALLLLPSTMSRASLLALCCGTLLFVFSKKELKEKLRQYRLIVVALLLLMGGGAYMLKRASADGRMFMNRISSRILVKGGLFGDGAGSFSGAYGREQALFFSARLEETGGGFEPEYINMPQAKMADCPEYAFNEYLNLGVEMGPLVMLLFISMVVAAVICSYRNGGIFCYPLLVYAVFALFSYPLHVMRLQLLFALILAGCASEGGGNRQSQSFRKWAFKPDSLILIVLSLFLSYMALDRSSWIKEKRQAEKEWKEAQYWYNTEAFDYLVEYAAPLLPEMQQDYRYLFALGQSLNRIGDYSKSDSVLLSGSKISSDPMFWNVMGHNALALGNPEKAEKLYKHAFFMVPNRLYPLTLLAKLYYSQNDTVKFLDMALIIEKFDAKVESAVTEKLRNEILDLKSKLTE